MPNARCEVWRCPSEHEEIRCALVFYNPFSHPTVMLRREVFECFDLQYDVTAIAAEDFAICGFVPWMSRKQRTYRTSCSNTGCTRRRSARFTDGKQARTAEMIIARQLAKLGMDSTPEKLALHRRLVSEVHSLSLQERLAARAWLDALERQNAAALVYKPQMFERLVAHFRSRLG